MYLSWPLYAPEQHCGEKRERNRTTSRTPAYSQAFPASSPRRTKSIARCTSMIPPTPTIKHRDRQVSNENYNIRAYHPTSNSSSLRAGSRINDHPPKHTHTLTHTGNRPARSEIEIIFPALPTSSNIVPSGFSLEITEGIQCYSTLFPILASFFP